ncbi:MAG: PepSY domain-containing protein [Bacteroidota bacterium]|nr:PepSY domain-containing protein [Bacteroidota bacterium]
MKQRQLLHKLHSISGLMAGLFIFCMSVSGALLVFHDEWDLAKQPEVQIQPGKPFLSIDSCYQLIRKAYPRARISQCNLPDDKQTSFRFTLYDSTLSKGSQSAQLFLHPQNGSILSLRNRDGKNGKDLMDGLSEFHSSLLLHKTGEWLVGVCALFFLFSLITGIFLYRKQVLSVLLFRKQAFTQKNFHQWVGVFALLFNLVIAFTGFWMQRYVFTKNFYQTFPPYQTTQTASASLTYSLSGELQKIKDSFPDFTPHVIYFPSRSGGNTAIYGSRSGNSFIHSKKLADALFLDSTGLLKRTAFVTDISRQDRFDIINSQIHFGRYGGWLIQLLYALLGLTGSVLSISGFWIWWRKKSFPDK